MRCLAVVSLLVAATAPVLADRTSSGVLDIRGPDQIVLGSDTTVTLRLRASATKIVLVANVGAISPPARDGNELRATFTPPTERFPQLALIAAIDETGALVDWLAIPMAGRAVMRVDTDPRAEVAVRVGGTEFGPVEASPRGVAEIPIIVPPSIRQVTTVATMRDGTVREKMAPLGARAFGTTLVVCSPRGDQIEVLATTELGTTSDRAPLITASSGYVGALISTRPGIFAGAFSVTDPVVDLVTISAGDPGVAASCKLRIPPAAPSSIDVAAGRSTFVAGTRAVPVKITPRYPMMRRRTLAVQEVTAHAELGALTPLVRASDGTWTTTWTLPDSFGARTQARARFGVAIPGGPSLTGEVTLALVAGEPTSIETVIPGPLRADGRSTATITARALDRWGNTISRPLTARGRGQMTTFVFDGRGTHARYTAPHSRGRGDDLIEIRDPVSGLSTSANLRLIPLPRLGQLSARVGYLSNLSRVAAPMATLSAAVRLPVLAHALVADVFAGGYTTAITSSVMTELVSARLTTIPALARVAYHVTRGRLDMWGGAGAGIAIARTRIASSSAGVTSMTLVTPAAMGFAGIAHQVGPGWLVLEGAYLHARIDGVLAGRIGGVVATAGFALDL